GLKKQRFRWAFGGVQILRKHIRPLLGLRGAPATKLTLRQRLAYLAGGVQWFNEVLGGLFTALLLVTAVGSALGGRLGLPALGCVGGAIALGLRHADSLAAMLAALLVMQAGLYASAPLCGLWAEGIQLTPARRLYAASAQNTGEWPAAPRVILRLGAAASLAA